MSSDRSFRVIIFSGKKKDWRKWSRKFLAMAVNRRHKDVLLVKLAGNTMTDEEKNVSAYNDLMLSMNEDVSFVIVDESCTDEITEGDSALAWHKLEAKYDSQTNSSKVKLMSQLNKSRLKRVNGDPDHWVSELEVIRTRLKKMKVNIEDDYFIIYTMNNLPGEYDNIFDALEEKIDEKIEPLTIETLRKKLSSNYDKLQDIEVHQEVDDDDEATLVEIGAFNSLCYVCGKFDHKGTECPGIEKPDDNRFIGKCNYCGKQGHTEIYCWKKKRDQESKKREGSSSSNHASSSNLVVEDDSDDDKDDLILMCRESVM